jgi:hypothetical protein
MVRASSSAPTFVAVCALCESTVLRGLATLCVRRGAVRGALRHPPPRPHPPTVVSGKAGCLCLG